MPNTEKIEKVAELKRRIASSEALLLTDFRGLTVADATELRGSLSEAGTSFAVVKNTLMKRAADESGAGELAAILEGPTGVAFVASDPVGAAKRLAEAIKKFPTLVMKGAWMEGRLLDPEQAQALSSLDSREAMLSKVAGMMKSEMSRAAYMFQALQGRFLSLVEALRDKTPGETVVAAEPAPETAEPPQDAEEPQGIAEETQPAVEAEDEAPPEVEETESEPAAEAAGETEGE